MRVLVCGGRDFIDYGLVYRTLDKIKDQEIVSCVIHGGARGADSLGKRWADETETPSREFPADWNRYGKSAGYVRNKQMLDEGRPNLVVAFPGGKGTYMMIKLAKEAGLEVLEISNP